MAESYYNAASGNWSTAANWKGGTNGDGTLPTSADDVYANGKAVTIDQDITVNSLRTTAGTTAVQGGSFTVSAGGRTLTVNNQITAGSTNCLTYSASSPNVLTINGAALTVNGSATTASCRGISSGSGTINLTGNLVGGSQSFTDGASITLGTLNVTGNATGGSGSTATGISGGATVTVSGTCTGGSGTTSSGLSIGTGTATVGNATGGSNSNAFGVTATSGTVTVTGTATGGSNIQAYGVNITGAGQLLLNAVTASATTPAVADSSGSGASAAFVRVAGPITNSTGVNALYVRHLCLVAACDWTIAKAGTPPAYNGTVTIGNKSGGGGIMVPQQMTGGYQ